MKLHLKPRKLIINKITSVKAITDNKCVKEVLRCVWSRAEWTQCFIFMGWASQGQRIGPDKDTTCLFLGAFLFLMASNPAMLKHTAQKHTEKKKHTHPSQSMAL